MGSKDSHSFRACPQNAAPADRNLCLTCGNVLTDTIVLVFMQPIDNRSLPT
jgi:hypothetical protein